MNKADLSKVRVEVRWHQDMWQEVNGDIPMPEAINKTQSVITKNEPISCPDCGGILVHEMGCVTCKSCGYSKCG